MRILQKKMDWKEELNLKSILKLFRLHSLFIIIFIITIELFVGVYSYIIPEEYQATTSIIPPEEAAGGGLTNFLQTLSGSIALGSINQANQLQLFLDYLKSREVAKIIADTLELKKDPSFKLMNTEQLYSTISSLLDVTIKRSGLILVTASTATSYFPNKQDEAKAAMLASNIANASIIALDKLNHDKNVSKSRKRREYVERVLFVKRNELDSVDTALENFRQKNKVIGIDDQSKAILGSAIAIGSDLAKAEIDLNLKLQEFEPGSPIIKSYRKKVENLNQQYNKIQRGGLTSSDYYSIPLNDVSQLIKNYTILLRDQKVLEQVNLYLETQKYQEAIQEESDVPVVEALDKALPPDVRTAPNRKIMLILGFLISLIISLSLVTGYALFRGSIVVNMENDLSK